MKKQVLCVLATFFYLNASAQKLDQLAKTPPMGWNSWSCFGMDVTEEQVKSNADYMANYMKSSGWTYIVVDMGWYYGENLNTSNFRMKNPPQEMDEYGRLIPSIIKFPSATNSNGLKPLADFIHSLGLKFGIHIMRGIPWQAVEKNTLVKGTNFRAKDIANPNDTCKWYRGMVGVDMTKPGSQEYYNSLIKLYAEWGVDYIKADDTANLDHQQEIEAIVKAIKIVGRPIVLSLSPGPVPVDGSEYLRKKGNLYRISGDMYDDWSYIKEQFDVCRSWQDYIIPNHWPDCDILPLGKMRITGTDGALANKIKVKHEETVNEYSRLTDDEKYTLLTLWFIFRSPLMMGGNLLENDRHTLQLLTNEEALSVNKYSINNHELNGNESKVVWIADDLTSGAKYVAFFNIDDKKTLDNTVTWEELGISGNYIVRDLWKKEDIGKFTKIFSILIPPHGARLYKFTQVPGKS